MKFLMMVRPGAEAPGECNESPELTQLRQELTKSGELLMTAGLTPLSDGARLSGADGRIAVTDGPFAEAKEVIGGFALVEARSKAHAIELGKRFITAVGGGIEVEIRQVMEE